MGKLILITGRPGSGKSTLARYLLRGIGEAYAGFLTQQRGSCPCGPLYDLVAHPSEKRGPISAEGKGRIEAVPETFETLGCAALQEALCGPEPVILMDELGRFERDCPRFLKLVDEVLQSEKTVLAVVKKEPLPHLQVILATEGARVIDLDQESAADARKELAQWLWKGKPLSCSVKVQIYREEKCFGPGPMQLLRGIERTGSLKQAAEGMGMAYSKAWNMVKRLEQEWGFPLLERSTGGAKGGGSLLTAEGQNLLLRYSRMLKEVETAADAAFERNFRDLLF